MVSCWSVVKCVREQELREMEKGREKGEKMRKKENEQKGKKQMAKKVGH